MRPFPAGTWGQLIAIDTRSLAMFRIIIALVVLVDLVVRSSDITFFLTDAGSLPRADLWRLDSNPYAWSLHALGGSWACQALLFVVHACAAAALAIGWRTRWAAIATWVLCVSLQGRNFQILQGGDVLLRCVLFWAMFLPLGARWSVDAWRASSVVGSLRPTVVRSAASLAILLQVAMIYVFTGILKWHPAWHTEGNALWYALQLDQFATAFGRWLRTHETWLPAITKATLWFELIGAFVAFMPWRNDVWRMVAVLSFWGLHLGMLLCLELGPFPYVCFAAWSLFLPGIWWDRLLPRSQSAGVVAPPAFWGRETALLMLLAYVLLWNARTVSFERVATVFPRSMNLILEIPRLDQMWSMFAPYPLREDGWFVARAALSDGTEIDLITGVTPDERPPPGPPYANERWRKYLMNLSTSACANWREPALAALRRQWNAAHPDAQVVTAELRFWRKTNCLGAAAECHPESFAKFP